jgi:HEAT repeats
MSPSRRKLSVVAVLLLVIGALLTYVTVRVAVPLAGTHAILSAHLESADGVDAVDRVLDLRRKSLAALGGPEEANLRLSLYIRSPRTYASHRDMACVLLDKCWRPHPARAALAYCSAVEENLADPEDKLTTGEVVHYLGSVVSDASEEEISDELIERVLQVVDKLLASPAPLLREGAMLLLRDLRETPDQGLPRAQHALRDQEPRVRALAMRAMEDYILRSPAAVKTICETLRTDKEASVRVAAAYALGAPGGVSPATLPALLAATRDRSEDVRYTTVCTLLRGQKAAASAVPRLREIVKTEQNVRVRNAAIGALRFLE